MLRTQGLARGEKHVTGTSSSPTSSSASRVALAAIIGGLCIRLVQAELLSLAAWRTVRLLVADSSISARMACRSSDAEITGNSKTSTHPRVSKHCNDVTQRFCWVPGPHRHSQYAGSASNTHARLSSSSMFRNQHFAIMFRHQVFAITTEWNGKVPRIRIPPN